MVRALLRRVFVSVDAEGLPFIIYSHLFPKASHFSELRRIATRLAATVSKVLVEKGYEVVVADSHGYMNMIDPLAMPRGSRLVRGFPRSLSMVAGARGSMYAVLLGYHSRAGVLSVFSHTYSGSVVYRVTVNGREVGELSLNALLLAEYSVPVALVAGSEELREEVEETIPWAVFLPLVSSMGYASSLAKSIEEVLDDLARAVEEAEDKAASGELGLPRVAGRIELCIEYVNPLAAEVASLIPSVRLTAPRKTCVTASSMHDAYRLLEAQVYLALWARTELARQA